MKKNLNVLGDLGCEKNRWLCYLLAFWLNLIVKAMAAYWLLRWASVCSGDARLTIDKMSTTEWSHKRGRSKCGVPTKMRRLRTGLHRRNRSHSQAVRQQHTHIALPKQSDRDQSTSKSDQHSSLDCPHVETRRSNEIKSNQAIKNTKSIPIPIVCRWGCTGINLPEIPTALAKISFNRISCANIVSSGTRNISRTCMIWKKIFKHVFAPFLWLAVLATSPKLGQPQKISVVFLAPISWQAPLTTSPTLGWLQKIFIAFLAPISWLSALVPSPKFFSDFQSHFSCKWCD